MIENCVLSLANFMIATPQVLEMRALLRRTDTKYLVPANLIENALVFLEAHYFILCAGEHRVATYETLYFDTMDFSHYHAHRRGVRFRSKIRIRHYVERSLSFLEIKKKVSGSESSKNRIEIKYRNNNFTDCNAAFISENLPDYRQLKPVLWTNFNRITLLSKSKNERVTIDFNLKFEGNGKFNFSNAAVVEIKQAPTDPLSPAIMCMKSLNQRPVSFSKYCTAVTFLHPHIPKNNFLPVIKKLVRMTA